MLIWCSYITFLRKKEIRVSMKCIILYVTNTLYFPPKSWAIITEMQIILRYSFSLLQKMSKTQKVQQYTLDEALEEPVPLHIARRNTGVSQVVQWVRNLPAMQETPVWFLGQKIPWRRAWQPMPVFLPGESQRLRTWWTTVPRVAKSRRQSDWTQRLHTGGMQIE